MPKKDTAKSDWEQCSDTCPLRTALANDKDTPVPTTQPHNLSQLDIAPRLYTPINEWQTRLLILHTDGDVGDELHADLRVADLVYIDGAVIHESQQKVQYSAISYAWGDMTLSRCLIKVNGIDYPITRNLYEFLQRCRQFNYAQILWVDAVCINQHNAAEKAVQVANMLSIYRKALQVLVWLGEHGENTKLSIPLLRSREWTRFRHADSCKENLMRLQAGILELYDRPWVRRVWIRQEVRAPKRVLVLCGSSQMPWGVYQSAANELVDKLQRVFDESSPVVKGGPEVLSLVSKLRRRLASKVIEAKPDTARAPTIGVASDDIVTLLRQAVGCRSSDPIDRIYALLGMSNVRQSTSDDADLGSLTLRVDYARERALVFEDLARYVMRREDSISSVLCLTAVFGGTRAPGLPSWCPDWTQITSFQPFVYFEGAIRGSKMDDEPSEQSTEKISDDRLKPAGNLPLSNDTRVRIVRWRGPLRSDDHVLSLEGTTLCTLMKDLPIEIDDCEANLSYKRGSIFHSDGHDTDENFASRMTKFFESLSAEERLKYKQRLEDKGSIVIKLSRRRKNLSTTLVARDIKFVQSRREVVPVIASLHFSRWKKNGSFERLKHMQVSRAQDSHVPLDELRDSQLFKRYRNLDDDNLAKRQRRAERRKMGTDMGSSSDSDESDENSCLDSDSEDDDGDGDETDTTASATDSELGRDENFKHYSVQHLNEMYNGHFPEEFAVPSTSEPGDLVVVVQGSALPLVLRQRTQETTNESRTFTFIGVAVLNNQIYNPWKDWEHGLDDYHRPQMSLYEHFQLLLHSMWAAGRLEKFDVL